MASSQNPDEVLPYVARVNSQLSDEVRKLQEGTCKKLYKQTRSFIDALMRSPNGQNTTYGPSICTISEVRECFEHSKQLDGDRPTHFTHVLELFITSIETLQRLCSEMHTCIGETVMALTQHECQRASAEKIRNALEFCREHLNEDTNFIELSAKSTIEKFRGLNTGEVANWGAVLNLIPVIVNKCQEIADATADWTSVTLSQRNVIFRESKSKDATKPRSASRQSGRNSATGMNGTQTQRAGQQAGQGQTRKPRKTYADKVDERNKGRISLLERPPWKPSSNPPHNLYPQLHIHLGDPTQHV
ncbi:uncharacterized protein [Diadema antillarum]|uniref:uncharacterized protein n=1 Tax=Diadema antillarum TaxID=105358 RepID=UPI003A8A6391